MSLRLACLFAPGPQTVEHALLAESLGYDRVWLADSPALWQDIWARMALVAEHTHRVQLGTAVLIPSLRHVVTQAAAIATIADIAPGRLTVGLATGFTGRAALGQHKRLPWAFVKRYVQQLRGLLHGEQVEVDGALCQIIPSLGFMPPRPITVPIFLAASGPRGYQVAREVADGIINPGRPPGTDFPECI
jgi:5,10-methylenetetrahydromethanopterin reductase